MSINKAMVELRVIISVGRSILFASPLITALKMLAQIRPKHPSSIKAHLSSLKKVWSKRNFISVERVANRRSSPTSPRR
jgi:hypothetical protein